jgi:hypothetical protein
MTGSPRHFPINHGVPERTRTSDTQFRKLLLYPAELRGQGLQRGENLFLTSRLLSYYMYVM